MDFIINSIFRVAPKGPLIEGKHLEVVHEPSLSASGSGNEVDIVALPNMTPEKRVRGALEPWTDDIDNETGEGFCWLQTIGSDEWFPHARVLAYRYNGLPETVVDILVQDLVVDREKTKRSHIPILLIGCSFGGSLAKQLFIATSPECTSSATQLQLHRCFKGFLFLGAHNSQNQPRLLTYTWPMSSLIRFYLTRNGDYREALTQIQRINWRWTLLGGENLAIACFYEDQELRAGPFGMVNLGVLVPKSYAVIEGHDSGVIRKNHRKVGIFSSKGDTDYVAVMLSMRKLLDKIAAEQSADEPLRNHQANREHNLRGGIKILALDGGGVRGLFTIIVLEAIMKKIRSLDGLRQVPKPCEYFDLIGGTSTGGLLALMLGRLEMDAATCVDQYKTLSKDIFGTMTRIPGKKFCDALVGNPWFSGDTLKSSIQDVIVSKIDQDELDVLEARGVDIKDAPLISPNRAAVKTFLCAMAYPGAICELLRTYKSAKEGPPHSKADGCKMWEAARASSAAPLYFPEMNINGQTYWDGGMRSNNPIDQVFEEACREFGEDADFRLILSIGTGRPERKEVQRGILGVLKIATQFLTDTENKHEQFVQRFRDKYVGEGKPYVRLNGGGELAGVDLADYRSIEKIEELAREYVRVENRHIEACARRLAKVG